MSTTALQLHSVEIVEGNKRRINPRFQFSKEGIDTPTARTARTRVSGFDAVFQWACTQMERHPDRRDYFANLHDEAIKASLQTALSFENLTTEEQYRSEIIKADALEKDFQATEPKSWRGSAGG